MESVDLSAAITAFELSEIVNLCKQDLHPWVVTRARDEIRRRVLDVMFNSPAPQAWEGKDNNWPSVCASSIGAAALYMEQDARLLTGMIWRMLLALKNYIGGFDNKGVTREGINYWQYGFSHFVYFADLLKEYTDGAIDLLADGRIQRIILSPNTCILSGNKVINFSDSLHHVDFQLGMYHYLKEVSPQLIVPQVEPMQQLQQWLILSRTLIWTLLHQPDSDNSLSTLDSWHNDYFPDAQWLISKRRTDKGVIAFAVKGGHNGEPHNHNDLGHFILFAYGEAALVDLGTGYYTRQYFNDERYEYYHTGSQGHSVPVINHAYQKYGKLYHADVVHYEEKPDCIEWKMELAKAYGQEHLNQFEREFIWELKKEEPYQLRMQDCFTFDEYPVSLTEVFISLMKPQWVQEGHIRIGSVHLYYPADKLQYELACVTEKNREGNLCEIWRVLLHVTDLKQLQHSYEFQFIV